MTIEEIKKALTAFIADGGDIDSLGTKDKLYKQINDSKIYIDGKKISTPDKFKLAGFPRSEKLTPMQKIKKILDDYAASGGNVFELTKGDPEYEKVKNIKISIDGVQITLYEKFKLAGYDKRVRKAKTVEEITAMLDEFVANGGNVDDLSSTDELYVLVKNIDERLSVQEKFALCKHPRGQKRTNDLLADLKKEALGYIAAGGSLHIERMSLPFFPKLHSAKKQYFRKTGKLISSQKMLESLGIRGYSDIYYENLPIFEIEKYKDENGYVDSYRKDEKYNYLIDNLAEKAEMPVSLYILLVADQDLKKSYLQTDVLAFTSQELREYKHKYGSYAGIERNAPRLYNRLSRMKRYFTTEVGKPVSSAELVALLGNEDEYNIFDNYTSIEELDFESQIVPLINLANANGNVLYTRDIDSRTYRMLNEYCSRTGTTIKEYFDDFGINYLTFKPMQKYSFVTVDKFPFIDEMRRERDKAYDQFKQDNPDLVREELFEQYLEICKRVYSKYKKEIEKFGLGDYFDSSSISSDPSTFGE